MSEQFCCGDEIALVAYLYDECEPGERDVIAAHVAACATCAGDIAALGRTRRTLTAWAPPDAALGFQITDAHSMVGPPGPAGSADTAGDSRVLRPARLWQQPLPAWAQAAAAALIFAAGLAAGAARGAGARDEGAPVTAAAQPGSAAAVAPVSVSRDDLARIERQLRGEISLLAERTTLSEGRQTRVAPSALAPASADDGVLRQVRTLIEESEQRQRTELLLRTAQIVNAFETQRRYDLAGLQKRVGELQGQTVEVKQHRQAIDYLVQQASTSIGGR